MEFLAVDGKVGRATAKNSLDEIWLENFNDKKKILYATCCDVKRFEVGRDLEKLNDTVCIMHGNIFHVDLNITKVCEMHENWAKTAFPDEMNGFCLLPDRKSVV